jgi:hypothetical protein
MPMWSPGGEPHTPMRGCEVITSAGVRKLRTFGGLPSRFQKSTNRCGVHLLTEAVAFLFFWRYCQVALAVPPRIAVPVTVGPTSATSNV